MSLVESRREKKFKRENFLKLSLVDTIKINQNAPPCEENSYTLSIVFIKQPDCISNNETPNDSWKIILIIVVSSVVGLALIFIAIILIVPSLRKKIFPHKRKNDGLKQNL